MQKSQEKKSSRKFNLKKKKASHKHCNSCKEKKKKKANKSASRVSGFHKTKATGR